MNRWDDMMVLTPRFIASNLQVPAEHGPQREQVTLAEIRERSLRFTRSARRKRVPEEHLRLRFQDDVNYHRDTITGARIKDMPRSVLNLGLVTYRIVKDTPEVFAYDLDVTPRGRYVYDTLKAGYVWNIEQNGPDDKLTREYYLEWLEQRAIPNEIRDLALGLKEAKFSDIVAEYEKLVSQNGWYFFKADWSINSKVSV